MVLFYLCQGDYVITASDGPLVYWHY